MAWVYGHRGASAVEPEHTRAALERALVDGADGIECDVRMTADGHLVLVHDSTTERIADRALRVSTSTLADLRSLELRRPSAVAEAHHGPSQRHLVMTLTEALELVCDAGNSRGVLVETKHPQRYGSRVEAEVIRVFRHFGLDKARSSDVPPVALMSFSPAAMRRAQELAPHVMRTFLVGQPSTTRLVRTPPGQAQSIGPGVDVVRAHPTWVKHQRQAGRSVFVWTVNDAAALRAACSVGVDIVISDDPLWARAMLAHVEEFPPN